MCSTLMVTGSLSINAKITHVGFEAATLKSLKWDTACHLHARGRALSLYQFFLYSRRQ
jgi:hypothetical protein